MIEPLTVSNYKEDKYYPRIVRVVDQILQTGNEVIPLDVFKIMGWLKDEDEQRWRKGQVPYLEQVLKASLGKLGRVLRLLRFHVHDLKLTPVEKTYTRKVRGRKLPLRFSKTGAPRLEAAYARHFWVTSAWVGEQKEAKARQKLAVPSYQDRDYEGGCLCSAVRYKVSGVPCKLVVCHCQDCRRAVGAPMVAWADFPLDGFTFTQGAPAVYSSSNRLERTFCSKCGTSLTNQQKVNAKKVSITIATLDQQEWLLPRVHIWCKQKVPWLVLSKKTDCIPGPD